MAFEGLSEKLQGALRKMTGRGRLSEQDVKAGMREVRMALLEADVNYAVAKDFIRKVTDRCVGSDVLSSLTPGQQVIKIVNEEMTELMGSTNARLNWAGNQDRQRGNDRADGQHQCPAQLVFLCSDYLYALRSAGRR